MPKQPQGSRGPDSWATYLHTVDIQATAAAVTTAAGGVCMGPMQVKDKGWMAIATDDATGGSFGPWQPIDHLGF